MVSAIPAGLAVNVSTKAADVTPFGSTTCADHSATVSTMAVDFGAIAYGIPADPITLVSTKAGDLIPEDTVIPMGSSVTYDARRTTNDAPRALSLQDHDDGCGDGCVGPARDLKDDDILCRAHSFTNNIHDPRRQLVRQVTAALAAPTADGRIRGVDLVLLYRLAGIAFQPGCFGQDYEDHDDLECDEHGLIMRDGPLDPAFSLDCSTFPEIVDQQLDSQDSQKPQGQLFLSNDGLTVLLPILRSIAEDAPQFLCWRGRPVRLDNCWPTRCLRRPRCRLQRYCSIIGGLACWAVGRLLSG